ncbi:hypothetical protein BH09PLA1_BH09PLA1_18930 [soil metagenome]
MDLIALPTSVSTGPRKWLVWLAAPIGALLILGAFWLITSRLGTGGALAAGGSFYNVHPIDLNITIAKDGELAAVNNIDILCRVEGQTTVQTLIKEGSFVKKGDIIITLDSSAIKQKIEDTTLDLQKAEADLTSSKEMREIQVSQNNANLEAAEVALTLAKLDLQGYIEGAYPQQVSKATSDLELAQLALKNKQESLAQTRALFTKGFVTATDIKTAEQDIVKATADVTAAENALDVLTKYTHESDLASKKNALSQAEQKLIRTEKENGANFSQKNADVLAKEQALEVMTRRMERYQEQLVACTIAAPTDGLVVYATSGDRNAQSALQEGAQVRERQALVKLPDTSSMKAVVRIGEAHVWKLREGQRARMKLSSGGMIEGTLTSISVLADNTQRWMNPDVREFPVDLVLDETPKGLKPGMRVDCEILIDHIEQVLAVPLASIFSADAKSYVFVRGSDGAAKPVEVKLGKVNNEYAQVLDGLTSGQDVRFLQIGEGAELLARAGIKFSAEGTDRGFAGGARGNRRGGSGAGAGGAGAGGANAANPGAVTPGGANGGPNGGPNGAVAPAGDHAAGGSELNPGAPGAGSDGATRPGGRRGGGRRGGAGSPDGANPNGADPSGGNSGGANPGGAKPSGANLDGGASAPANPPGARGK